VTALWLHYEWLRCEISAYLILVSFAHLDCLFDSDYLELFFLACPQTVTLSCCSPQLNQKGTRLFNLFPPGVAVSTKLILARNVPFLIFVH
jgi:hypothetical protein